MAMDFQVSVVIPTLDSPTIQEAVDACLQQLHPELVKEILIVGRQHRPVLQDSPKVCYHEIDPPTPAHNRNIGAQFAAADWILFIDSDCIPSSECILHMRALALSGEQVIAGAVSLPAAMRYWGQCDHYFGFRHQIATSHANQYIPYAASLNFCIRKDLLRSLGGFNEGFTTAGGEDRELSWRITQQGVKIRFSPTAVVLHNHSRDGFLSAWKHIYHYGEVTAHFRLMVFSEMSPDWKAGYQGLRVPVLGEVLGLLRIGLRALLRLSPRNLSGTHLKLLPGLAVLDLAHTLGMISGFRKQKFKNLMNGE